MPFVSQLAKGTLCTLFYIDVVLIANYMHPLAQSTFSHHVTPFSISYSFPVLPSELAPYICEEGLRSCCLWRQLSVSHMKINLLRRAFHWKVPLGLALSMGKRLRCLHPRTQLTPFNQNHIFILACVQVQRNPAWWLNTDGWGKG